MLFLVQGSIFLKVPIDVLPTVSELGEPLPRYSYNVVYVYWDQVMDLYEPEAQSFIKMLPSWREVRPCVQSLGYCNNLVPNKRPIGDE